MSDEVFKFGKVGLASEYKFSFVIQVAHDADLVILFEYNSLSSITVDFISHFGTLPVIEPHYLSLNSKEDLSNLKLNGGQYSISLHAFFKPLNRYTTDRSFVCFSYLDKNRCTLYF